MKFSVNINDKPFEIEVSCERHETVPSRIKINGRVYPIQLSEECNKEYPKQIIIQNISHEAEFEYGEDGFPKYILLDGKPADVEIEFLGKSKLSKTRGGLVAESHGNAIISPMPGKIIKLAVRENQKVEKGDLCIILEAMKMENELEAQRSGIVRKLNVKEGDLVEIDDVLIVFDEEDEMFF
jgi:acetyl/propionyl-CoA carboxylase alpha subunit